MDEHQAIEQLKQGNLRGLETLMNLYQLQAIRAASLILGERDLAEDIVQSAFLRAAKKIDQFDDRRPFKPWFLRTVVHDAIKAANKQKRQISLDDEQEGTSLDLADLTPLPEEWVETKEARDSVRKALKRLAPQQRAAVVLRYYLGLSEADIGIRLKHPEGTIKWWLHSARKRLKRLLHADFNGRKSVEEVYHEGTATDPHS